MPDFNYDEFLFRIRDIECEVKTIDIQSERLQLERDKLVYELNELDKIYENHIADFPVKEEVPAKPKKLKKSNDKPSENHVEVQL